MNKNKVVNLHNVLEQEQIQDLKYCKSIFLKYYDVMENCYDTEEVNNAYLLAIRIRLANIDKNKKVYDMAQSAIKIYVSGLYKVDKNTNIIWLEK